MKKRFEYSPDTQDVFDPSAAIQTIFRISVDLDTLKTCLSDNVEIPEGVLKRLTHDTSFVHVQRQRWGDETLNSASIDIGSRPIQWDLVDSMLSDFQNLSKT